MEIIRPTGTMGAEIINILDCPVCKQPMHPPILLCGSGHSICHQCKNKLDRCSVCNTSLQFTVRCDGLERLSKLFYQPCPFTGCNVKVSAKNHEISCKFRVYTCPIRSALTVSCTWTGKRSELVNHAKKKHPKLVYNVKPDSIKMHCAFLKDSHQRVTILYWGDDVFTSSSYWDEGCNKIYKFIKYIEPCNTKYQYFMELHSADKSRMQMYRRDVHREDDEVEDLIKNEDCFIISSKQVSFYKNPDNKPLKGGVIPAGLTGARDYCA